MSKSVIDERVVQMSFDNDQFEKGVAQTINSLEKLDTGLDKISDGTYFQNMETSIKKVEEAFTASGMVINGILISIGQTINQYINKGLAALTSGIRGGMAEYETQMGATQTILANVKDEGKGIEDVTAALDELNTYADKTIYNFTEMTRNIGMFTAAGANLDTSVATIKGLANAAALVGANATTAARAWYQVSQAMAAGSFKLMDWRSLEISNIAGEGFKSVLTEVARKDGLAVAKMIDNGTALRDTLKDGWLTADRFAEAMRILSGDLDEAAMKSLGYTDEQVEKLKAIADEAVNAAIKVKSFGQLMETTAEAIGSGWAVTFRTLIGDFEKARTLFTRVSITINSVIDKISDYRNHFLDFVWNSSNSGEASAYKNFQRALDNLLAIFSTFIGSLRAGFDNVFDWTDVRSSLGKFASNIQKFTKAFVINDTKSWTNYLENKEKVNKAIEEGLDPDEVIKHTLTESELANYWDLDAVNNNIKNLIRIFRGLFSGIDIIFTTIGETISWVVNLIPGMDNFFGNLKDGNENLLSNLANIMDKVTMVRDMIVDLNLIPSILNLIKQDIINIVNTNPLIQGMLKIIYYIIAGIKALVYTFQQLNINPLYVLLGVLKAIGGAVVGFAALIGQGISKVVEFFTGITDFSFFKTIGNEIIIFVALMNELGKGTISVAQVFEYYKQRVLDAFNSIMNSKFVQGFIGFFVNLWDTIKSIGENIKNAFTTLGEYFSNIFEEYNVDLGKVGIFGALTGVALLLYKVIKDADGIMGLASRFGEVLSAIANKINSEALWNVAKSVGVLAASLFVLSLVPYEKLLDTASVIIAVLMMVLALTAVIKGTFDAMGALRDKFKPFEKALENITKGLSAFLKKAGWAVMLEAIGDALIKVVIAIVALAAAFKFMPNEIEKAIGVIAALAAAFGLLALMFSLFSEVSVQTDTPIKDIQEIANGVKQFAKFAGIALVLESISNAIIKVSLALALLAKVSQSGADVWTAVGQLTVIMLVLGGLLIAMEAVSKRVNPAALAAVSLTVIAFGAVVAGLAIVATIISKIGVDDILPGLLTVGGIMLAFGGLIALVEGFYKKGSETVFLGAAVLVASVAALVLAFAVAGSMLANSGASLTQLGPIIAIVSVVLTGLITLAAICDRFGSSATTLLAVAVPIVAVAGAILAIGYALSMLSGISLDPSVVISLGIMGVIVFMVMSFAVALAAAAALIPGVGEVLIAAVGVTAALIASIGAMALMISFAVLNLQTAAENVWHAVEYIASSGDYIRDTLIEAAKTILTSIPNLYVLFVSVGIAIGSAIIGLLMGLGTMINGIVLQACTMILQIIIQISSWVNSNAELIKTALTELFTAILNIAIIALQVAFKTILPHLLEVIVGLYFSLITTVWSIISKIFTGIGEALKGTILEPLGDLFTVAGQALQWFVDNFSNLGQIIIDGLKEISPMLSEILDKIELIPGVTLDASDSTEDLANTTEEATQKMSVSWGNVKSVQETAVDAINKKLLENAEELAKHGTSVKILETGITESNKKVVDSYNETTEQTGEALETQVENTGMALDSIVQITDQGLQVNTDLFTNAFNVDLLNQDTFNGSYISGVDWLGDQVNNETASWMIENEELYRDYYGDLEDYAKTYYENMVSYTEQMTGPGVDNSVRQAAQEQLNAAKAALAEINDSKGYDKWSLKYVLEDGIDWYNSTGKKKQEAVFTSWASLGDAISNYTSNYTPKEVDTSMYSPNFSSGGMTDTSALQNELKDRNDLINKADSEIQPKDLTPTIDLDSLKNEVNQANGIMTGSLLAAQNAAIGDYINTDSELNPFLKDRWQNVYNFTQNNYSPKALSRIDIYRQTQNQLRLSRGM